MTLLTETADRIKDQVPALSTIGYVADLAILVASGGPPQREVMAFVLPLGFDDLGGGESVSGAHTQMLADSVGVAITVKALGDVTAKRALPQIDVLKDSVLNAVAGWGPDNYSGVFKATKGRLVSVTKGLVIYQLDFRISNQLRIIG